jgi:hypothetical protein
MKTRQMYVQLLQEVVKKIERTCMQCDTSNIESCKACIKLKELEKKRDRLRDCLENWNYSS